MSSKHYFQKIPAPLLCVLDPDTWYFYVYLVRKSVLFPLSTCQPNALAEKASIELFQREKQNKPVEACDPNGARLKTFPVLLIKFLPCVHPCLCSGVVHTLSYVTLARGFLWANKKSKRRVWCPIKTVQLFEWLSRNTEGMIFCKNDHNPRINQGPEEIIVIQHSVFLSTVHPYSTPTLERKKE